MQHEGLASRPAAGWARFFYSEEPPYGLALVRIMLPLILLQEMGRRWPHARELYSSDGAPAQLSFSYGWGNLLPELPGEMVVGLITALLFFLLAAAVGWKTRWSLIASTVLYTYLNLLDAIGTMTKYSVIASHVLLLLSCSGCGAIWSLDSWLERRSRAVHWPGRPRGEYARVPVWPRRLIQLLIGIVYFGAAITKMHTPEFFSGDQLLFWMVTHYNGAHPLGEWLTLYPVLLVVFAYIAIVWEVLFVFLAWKDWGRPLMLGLGALFHLMTALTLGLFVFPAVCLTIYLSFLEERDLVWLARRGRRWARRHRRWLRGLAALRSRAAGTCAAWRPRAAAWSTAVYVLVFVSAAVAGVEAEYHLDPYRLRGPHGPLALREVDPKLVRQMLAPEQPLRPQDKFFAFEVGTLLVGQSLMNRRETYRHGETVIAQCSLNPPHDDMWVECNLHDARNRIIDRVGAVVAREMHRRNFYYRLTEALEPGDYFVVLKASGREVARRRITLRPAAAAPLAN